MLENLTIPSSDPASPQDHPHTENATLMAPTGNTCRFQVKAKYHMQLGKLQPSYLTARCLSFLTCQIGTFCPFPTAVKTNGEKTLSARPGPRH